MADSDGEEGVSEHRAEHPGDGGEAEEGTEPGYCSDFSVFFKTSFKITSFHSRGELCLFRFIKRRTHEALLYLIIYLNADSNIKCLKYSAHSGGWCLVAF